MSKKFDNVVPGSYFLFWTLLPNKEDGMLQLVSLAEPVHTLLHLPSVEIDLRCQRISANTD